MTMGRVFGRLSWAAMIALAASMGSAARAEETAAVPIPAPTPPAAVQDAIVVEVLGLKTEEGWIACALWASAEGYPKDAKLAIQRVYVVPKGDSARCRFAAPPPGTYAVAVYHDVNSNHKLDTNFLGIPSEPVGASNDAKGSMGPPHFEDAKFSYPGKVLTLQIHMH
jgi:uncharacterized protein (DUF2141 family)